MYRGENQKNQDPRQRTVYSLQFLLKMRSPCERAQSLCDEYNIFIFNPPTDLLLRIGAGFVQLITESETIVVTRQTARGHCNCNHFGYSATWRDSLRDRWPRLVCLLQRQEGHIPCVIVFPNICNLPSLLRKKKSPEDMQIRPEPWILRSHLARLTCYN
jgi:hypothetical protein